MPSSTTLYTSPGNAGNVASKNFTTLYSGSGSINPTQPYGNANVVGLLAASTDGANTIGVISATGNIISDGFFIGDGGLLSNIAGANVSGNVLNAQFVTNPAQANITSVGTLTGLSSTGNITAPYFLGNVVGNITGNIVVGGANTEVLVNNNGNIGPSPGLTFSNASNVLSTSGSVTAVGNIQGNYFLGNGSQLTGLPATYGNANVATFLATFGSNVMSTTGNVTAGYFIGNGSQLTGLPAGYSNADVATFMANFGSNSISTSGNVTTGNITVTTDAVVQGNLTVNGNTTFINSNVVTINDKFINVANNAATAASANGGGLGVGPVGGEYATLEYLSTPNVWATNIGLSVTGNVSAGNISATGNTATGGLLTDNYYYANGTPVSFAGTYSNANVVNLMAAFGSNSISTSGNVSAGNVLIGDLLGAGNVTATGNVTGAFIVGNGSLLSNITGANVTGTVANATFATSAGSATTAATVTGNAQANITSVGTLTSLSVSGNTTTGNLLTGGIVSATGNVTGNYILGNGSQLTGLPATYGNADVVSLLAAFGANSISTTGNVTAGYVIGNGSLLSNITGANVTGTVANAAFATTAGSATTAATVTGNAQANITSVGTLSSLSVTGTTTSGNILTAGIVSATGNVTGNYFIGNGSQLTGITASPGGSPFQFQYNNSGAFGGVPNTNFYTGNGTIEMALTKFEATGVSGIVTVPGTAGYVSVTGNVIAGNVFTGGVVSATGNVTGNYFIGNGSQLTGVTASAGGSNTQIQFNNAGVFAGNAAMTFDNVTGNIGLGNLIVGSNNTGNANVGGSAQRINTIAAYTGITGNATAFGNGQMVIGNGYFGNLNLSLVQGQSGRAGKLALWDSANVAEVGAGSIRYSGISSLQYVSLSSNIANTASQLTAGVTTLAIGGGSAGNAVTLAQGPGQIFGFGAATFVGQPNTTVALGNTTTTGASGLLARLITNAGSVTTTGVGVNGGVTGAGNTVNQIGVVSLLQAGNTSLPPAKAYAYYMGPVTGSGSAVNSSLTNNNASRIAGEYYFLRNDDAVAQTQLGTLRSYNEFNSVSATTSGALTIDKAVSQVHQVNLAGNITSVTYSNMVSNLSDSVNTDEEVDTVTIIFNQGATGGYSVALPTGATYKYAGGGNTVTTTANSVTLVAVTVVRIGGTATYLTTVSPGFT